MQFRIRILWPLTRKVFEEYLAGLTAGDGQIEEKRITITDSNPVFLQNVARLIQRYLNIEPRMHKRRNVNAYYLRIYSKNLVAIIESLINKLYDEPSVNFIRGYFDAEGSIWIDQNRYIVIEIASANQAIINNIKKSLHNSCIYGYMRTKSYYDKRRKKTYTIHRLVIKQRNSVGHFLKNVGIRHPKHIMKLISHGLV